MHDDQNAPTPATQHSEYQAPQVERVMDAEELVREVHYAGEPVPISLRIERKIARSTGARRDAMEDSRKVVSADGRAVYEPPEVERVLDAEELAREVHYAGDIPVIS